MTQVGDYDAWKTMFDADPPGAQTQFNGLRVFRMAEDPEAEAVGY